MARVGKSRRKLTAQQRAAVEARAHPGCKNNIEALLKGYPKAKGWSNSTRAKHASELFKKPHVALALEHEMDKLRSKGRNKTALTAQTIINEFQHIALSSITDVVQYEKKKGRFGVDVFVMKTTDFDKLSDATRRAMKKIKIRTKPVKTEGDDGTVTVHEIQEIEFELFDKQKALDSLAKYFNLYVEKIEVNHTGSVGVHTTMQEMRVLFDAMTAEERAGHLDKLMGDMVTIDVENQIEEE